MTDYYPYKIRIPLNIPKENHEKILDWINECIEEDKWSPQKIDNKDYVCFTNVEDAVAFKTVWYPDADDVQ